MSSVASILTGTPAGLEVPSLTGLATINTPVGGLTISSNQGNGTAAISVTNQGVANVAPARYEFYCPAVAGGGLVAGDYQLYQYTAAGIQPVYTVPYSPVGGYGGNPGDVPFICNLGLSDGTRIGYLQTDVAGATTVSCVSINSNSRVILTLNGGANTSPLGATITITPGIGFTVAGAVASSWYSYFVLG